jgi:hypothetical protein
MSGLLLRSRHQLQSRLRQREIARPARKPVKQRTQLQRRGEHTSAMSVISPCRLGHAAVNSTGSAGGERNATPLITGSGAVGSRCRSGQTVEHSLIATVVSIRASGMPDAIGTAEPNT